MDEVNTRSDLESEMKRSHDAFMQALLQAGAESAASADDTDNSSANDSATGMGNERWALVRSVFPNICPRYVLEIYRQERRRLQAYPDNEQLISAILEAGKYPTAQENKRRKLQEAAADDQESKWGPGDGVRRDVHYYNGARHLLQIDFPAVPVVFLRSTLGRHKSLFTAYAALADLERDYENLESPPYVRGPTAPEGGERMPSIRRVQLPRVHQENLTKEFRAARAALLSKEREEQQRAEQERLETENEMLHMATGGLVECECCCSDFPINRVVPCRADTAHFFCGNCVRTQAEAQIGRMRYEIPCMSTGSPCDAGFSPSSLADILSDTILEKLSELRQRHEIDQAGLDDLEECPFCDFRAIYPKVEENREFECLGSCRKISCRICKLLSHLPKTCEEARTDTNVSERHRIEEAMSKALIRECPNPKCKTPMVKEDGCNKLYCGRCRTLMCYVCKKDISNQGYNHFTNGKCILNDHNGVGQRHFHEVISAHRMALDDVLKDNPDFTEDDFGIQLPPQEFLIRPRSRVRRRPVVLLPPHPPLNIYAVDPFVLNGRLPEEDAYNGAAPFQNLLDGPNPADEQDDNVRLEWHATSPVGFQFQRNPTLQRRNALPNLHVPQRLQEPTHPPEPAIMNPGFVPPPNAHTHIVPPAFDDPTRFFERALDLTIYPPEGPRLPPNPEGDARAFYNTPRYVQPLIPPPREWVYYYDQMGYLHDPPHPPQQPQRPQQPPQHPEEPQNNENEDHSNDQNQSQ